MASKRKCDTEEDRGVVSKIPSLFKTNISVINSMDKENLSSNFQPIQSMKRAKIAASTPKAPTSTTAVLADQSNFRVPRVPNAAARPKMPGLGSRVRAGARKPITPPRATSKKLASPPKATVAHATSTTAVGNKGPKRKAWDLKGRVADLEEHMQALLGKNREITTECQVKGNQVTDLEMKMHQYEEENMAKDQTISALKDRNSSLESDNRHLNLESQTLKTDLRYANTCVDRLQTEVSEKDLELKRLRFELAAKNTEIEIKERRLLTLEEDQAKLEAEYASVVARLEETDCLLRFNEKERKRQHNVILELKGNIRVFCRVRPSLPEEPSTSDYLSYQEGGSSLSISKPLEHNETIAVKNRPRTEFKFDRVFTPDSSQELVFEEISQLVQSALDGYNVCIFAYGQTGSGKTYTMEGPAEITDFVEDADSPLLGMIPRAVNQVFDTARGLVDRGWQYKMEVSIMEIYNEVLKDLLSTDSKSTQLSLHKGTDSAMATTTTRSVTCEKDVYKLLRLARKHRVVAATSCNEHSSRSHSIFRLKITGHNSQTEESCEGVLSLVDLAGSERLKEQSISNSRLRETKNINKSLSNLGNVIMALAQKADHIPYRNSKLTHVLMNSLGGNSKTLMFVNVSPKEENYTESLNSLRFGTQVNNCNIGTATKVIKKESF